MNKVTAPKTRIDLTLKSDHVDKLREIATKCGISVSAANDLIIEDYISAERMRNRAGKILSK